MLDAPQQSPITRLRSLSSVVNRTRVFDVLCVLGGFAIPSVAIPGNSGTIIGLFAAFFAAVARMLFGGSRWLETADVLVSEFDALTRNGGDVDFESELLAELPVGYLVMDETATVLFCSHSARELLERNPVGQHIASVFRASAVIDAVNDALRDQRRDTFEFDAWRPRERRLRAQIRSLTSARPLPPASTNTEEPRVVLAIEDVTKERQSEAMRIDFIANASHELRTPLAAIGGLVETLRGPARDDEKNRERFLEIIAGQTDRMSRLVDDLLSLSRIELEENNPPTQSLDLLPLIYEACDAMSVLAAENDVRLETHLPETLPHIIGDADEIAQVFVNLLGNAIKYGGSGKPVVIRSEVHEENGQNAVAITVEDFGTGIEASDIPRLTERFYRVDREASLRRGGTGLGLAIVKHIMSRHRGRLEITSELAEGSCFTVIFSVLASSE